MGKQNETEQGVGSAAFGTETTPDNVKLEEQREATSGKGGLRVSQTVIEAVMPGMSADAADMQNVSVLVNFRIKVFSLLFFQSVVVVGLAYAFEMAFDASGIQDMEIGSYKSGIYVAGTVWLFALIALVALAVYRKQSPKNFVLLMVFNVIGAAGMATLNTPMKRLVSEPDELKSPHLLVLAVFTLGILLLGVMSCLFCGGRTLKVFSLYPYVAVFTTVVYVVLCASMNTAPWYLVVLCAILNVGGLLWVAFHMDKLASTLKVDEYMQPLIVVWGGNLVVLFLVVVVSVFILAAAAADGLGSGEGCDCFQGTYFWYSCTTCDDCFIHDNERERRQKKHEQFEAMRLAKEAELEAAGAAPGEVAAAPIAQNMEASNKQ